MMTWIAVVKAIALVVAIGGTIEALLFHLAMYKPRDNRYGRYMLGSFVMVCMGLGAWFLVQFVEAVYIEMFARGTV